MLRKPFATHPILFAIFPILFLYTHNIGEFSASVITVPLTVTVSSSLILWALLSIISKDKQKAALGVSGMLLLFFSYGHIYQKISTMGAQITFGGFAADLHSILFPAWGGILFIVVRLCLKTRKDVRTVASFLNIVSISLVAICIFHIASFKIKTRSVIIIYIRLARRDELCLI